MKQRIITAAFGFAVLIPILLFADTVVLPIAVAVFASIGVWEMLGCIGVRKKLEITIPALIYCAGLSLCTRYVTIASGSIAFSLAIYSVVTFIFLYYLMSMAVVSKGTKTIADMTLVCMMTMYITVGFNSILMLHDISLGYILYLLVFVGAWIPDAGGYFVGRACGKHKLIPDVSPKKTVEGAIGGIICAGVFFVLFGVIIGLLGLAKPHYLQLAITGILLAFISILGDLIASLIKRHYNIKDYGKLFPGHGGVMDRFDSVIAVAPFLLMICSYPEIFSLFEIL